MRKFLWTVLSVTALSFTAFGTASITIDSVRQRMPWNGLVDIHYTLAGLDSSQNYRIAFDLQVADAAKHSQSWLVASNVTDGAHTLVWDASANLGDYVIGKSSLIAALVSYPIAKDTGATFQSGNYLILDLSDFTIVDMANVTDGTVFNTDTYKTKKMAFRKVPGCCFYMQGTTDDSGSDPGHLVTLTRDYWIAVFPLTEAQYALVVNGDSTSTSMIPRNDLNWESFRGSSGTYNWPSVTTVDANSVVGKFRAKLPDGYAIDLPTEAQWECAARAGARTKWFWGSDDSKIGDYAIYTGNNGTYGAPGKVGQRAPNAWGLYDMIGNTWCYVLDGYTDNLPYGDDPAVSNSGTRVRRGGTWNDPASMDNLTYRHGYAPSASDTRFHGGRLVLMRE